MQPTSLKTAGLKPACKHIATQKPRSRSQLDIVARGGGNFGDFGRPSSDDSSRRLILPGQGGPPGGPGRIVLPNQDNGFRPSGAGLAIPGQPAQVRNFRPPPGFMNTDSAASDIDMSVDEMISKLRTRSAHWHELAKLMPALASKGQSSEMVEEATGIERRVQSVWSSASQVHSSLKSSGELEGEVMDYFDNAESEFLLYELRFLSTKQRVAAARYIVAKQLSQQETLVLAKAIKEYERRSGEKEGFSESPADALAYKYYRDALECRKKDDIQVCVKKGLAVAETEKAKEALMGLSDGDFLQTTGASATLNVLRLTTDEVGYRPIVVAGAFESTSADTVRSVPKASCEGVFGNFSFPREGLQYEWIALPPWSIVTLAVKPVALSVEDCAENDDIRQAMMSKSQAKDDLKKVRGSGIIVIDCGKKVESIAIDQYYVVEEGSGLKLVAGSKGIENLETVLGQVLFLCRPPGREQITTSELLQV